MANWAGDGDEAGVDWSSVGANELVVTGTEGDDGASNDGASGAESEGWEGFDWELGVGGWAADDEWSSQGVDLVEGEGDIEWLGEWELLERSTDVGAVASLNGQDGTSCGEVVLVHDAGGSTEVGGNSDTLQDGGEGNESSWGGDTEAVCALCNSSASEGGGQEADVGLLISCDLLEVVVEWVSEAGSDELG